MADNKVVQQTMETIFKALSKDLQKIQPNAEKKLSSSVENCFKRSGENQDRFASCMVETQKKVQQLTETFQFRQLYLSYTVQNCLSKGTDSNKCRDEGIKTFTNSINWFLKQIDQI